MSVAPRKRRPAEFEIHEDAESTLKQFLARKSFKSAAILLVIPGATIVGVGIGMLAGQVIPATLIGIGAGMLLWGMIVALTD